MLVDYKQISEEALKGVAREYVVSQLAENDEDIDLENWTEKVISSIKSGELVIEYSEANQSIYLKRAEDIVADSLEYPDSQNQD